MKNRTNLQDEIIAAGKVGDIEKMGELMQQGADPLKSDPWGRSAGYYAMQSNPGRHKDLAKYIARFLYNS